MAHAAHDPQPAKAGTHTSEARERTIIGSIYDAALDRSRWESALAALSDYARLRDSFVAVADFATMRFPVIETALTDPALEREFLRKWATPERNLWLRAAVTVMPVGRASSMDRMVPRRQLEQTDHYHYLLVPWHGEQCIGSVLSRDRDGMAMYSAYRSARDPTLDEHDEEVLARFVPHLQRALQIHQRLAGAEVLGQRALDALHHLEIGVVLLDGEGCVLFANRCADEILDCADGLTATGGRLVASVGEDHKRFAKMVFDVSRTGQRRGFSPGGRLLLARPSGKRALSVILTPLGDNPYHLGTRVPVAAAFLSDPERERQEVLRVFAQRYRLTRREAVVAGLVASGAALPGVADSLGLKVSTARTHLYRVFDKVGVRRQAELVKLFLSEPGAVDPDTRA